MKSDFEIDYTETKNSLVIGLLNDIYGEHIKGDICLRIFNDQNNQYKELIYIVYRWI